MKSIKTLAIAASALLFSCSDFLELKPQSNINADLFNSNAEELAVSLAGCYNGMQGALYREWAVSELRSDNARLYSRSSSTSIFEVIREIDCSAISTTNYLVEECWNGIYNNINRCNIVLRDLHVVEDPTLYAKYQGEALFIRAYHYFTMVRLWGGVFLITEPLTADQARSRVRNSPDEIYAQIEGDLEWIIRDAMVPDAVADADLGRVTMMAVKSMLAKVYMTHYEVGSANYAKAKPLLEQVIAGVGDPQSKSDLVPYDKIFDISNEMNKEIIFAVRYMSGNKGIGCPFGNEFAPSSSMSSVIIGSGKSYNYPTTEIIDLFNENPADVRKDVTLAEKYFNTVTQAWVDDDVNSQCRYVKKYLSPVTTVNDGENDVPVIRVADVLLLYAEIVNELNGPTAPAIKYVNMVRDRAGLAALTSEDTADSYHLRKAIRNERRMELAFENQRWYDLLRWKIAVAVINDHYDTEFIYSTLPNKYHPTIVEWQTILPIPLNVMMINPELTQNYGY